MTQLAVDMQAITKTFPRVVANAEVSLSVRTGEIHALVGENGAGKSTLMNILYGLLRPDTGTLTVNGTPVTLSGPKAAMAQGIGMVHQHFMLIASLTVAENVVLGREPTRWAMTDMVRANRLVAELSDRFGLRVDPTAKVETLGVGIQQRIEILKTLYRGAGILILDEPTAVLAPQEVTELFQILRRLSAQGKTIIFITHKLQEVMAVAHRVTVMRQGRGVGTLETAHTTPREIARLMVGREVMLRVDRRVAHPGETVLKIEGLQAHDRSGRRVLEDVGFEIRAAEIFGLAGVEGNGQTELVEVLAGLRLVSQGTVHLRGENLAHQSPRQRREAGLGHIPEDRLRRGLIADFTVADNLVLGVHHKPPFARRWGIAFMDKRAIRAKARRLIQAFDIRPPLTGSRAAHLSGGNQQKTVVAREMDQDPRLLIAAQPTRGVDVGSIEFVHRQLLNARDAGKAILLVSADLEEILALSDRIGVMYAGRLVAILDAAQATPEQLGMLMTGGQAVPATNGQRS